MNKTSAKPPEPLRKAIELTIRTVNRRSLSFRNTIIAVVVISLTALSVSLAFRSPRLLAVLFFLPLPVNLFVLSDAMIIKIWSKKVIGYWTSGKFDLVLFSQTISTVKALPQTTVAGMLELLPLQCGNVGAGETVLRKALYITAETILLSRCYRTVLSTALNVVISTSSALVILTFSFRMAMTVFCILPFLIIIFYLDARSWKIWHYTIRQQIEKHELQYARFSPAARTLPWEITGMVKKINLLESFESI
jgi:hypothetical protein